MSWGSPCRSAGSSSIAGSAVSVCWNRTAPDAPEDAIDISVGDGSERQNAALGWGDVRGVVSRTPLRDTGRRIDVPVAVTTWVAAFVVGQAASALIISASGAEDLDNVPIPTLFAGVAA